MPSNAAGGTARVDVWVADVTRLPAGATTALLDDEERARAETFRSAPARELFVASRALQRLLAGRYLGRAPETIHVARRCRLCDDPRHGRPYLPDADGLDFSVSHSGIRVVLAYTDDCRVGVDLEVLDRRTNVAALADQVLSAEETAHLDGRPDDARRPAFLRLWTRKEAVLKLTGHGLAVPLSHVTVTGERSQVSPTPSGWPDTPVWLTDLALADNHAAALATTVARPEVTVRTVDSLF